ncbi:MAG: type II toxin-antitoxin system VapC family toxin [Oscillatoria sp. SIO1A7]|nr:type II toxin-antitoxin system VapC family toxin [Oscillatoria sp. SIO1A7]
MSRYVVDASVAAKWFIEEEHNEIAIRLLNESHELLAPDFARAEIGNILWKKIRVGDLGLEEAEDILQEFSELPVQLYPIEERLAESLKIAPNFDRSIYDCFYLALAIDYDCQMVTSDRKLYNALKDTSLGSYLCWIEDLP